MNIFKRIKDWFGKRKMKVFCYTEDYSQPPENIINCRCSTSAVEWKAVPDARVRDSHKPKAMTAPIIPKGWKRHDGGKCPVNYRQKVDLIMEFGDNRKNVKPNSVIWQHSETANDVIAYRIIKPKPVTKKRSTKRKVKK